MTGHAGDCTIYAAMINGEPTDGICTCGYGWQCVRDSNLDEMYSAERTESIKQQRIKPKETNT